MGGFLARRRRRRWRRWWRHCTLMDMGRKPFTEEAKERRRIRTMEALVPPDVLDVGNDENHAARSPNDLNYDAIAVPTTNYDAIAAAPACSLEWSTTAAACPPQSRSSFAHTAPTMGDGGQWAPGQRATTGQRATPRQRATPQQTSQWTTTLIAIGCSLSSNMRLWLDFVILSIEQLLNVLQTIRTAYRESAIVGRDGLIESEAVSV